jgi:hypothetical protein
MEVLHENIKDNRNGVGEMTRFSEQIVAIIPVE